MHAKLFATAAAVALVPVFSTPAIAVEADAAENTSADTIVVTGVREQDGYAPKQTTAAKVPAELRDIPQTIDVIPDAVLRDQRALSVQDALKNVPGVGMSHGDGQRDQVTIRGFSAISDQFIDGFRDDALYFRDLSNIERIEVIKGPAAVLYGRGSSGGLINRVTRKPGENVASVTLTAGSWDTRRGEFDVGRVAAGGETGFRLTGALERSGSFRQYQFLDREAIAPSFLFRPGPRTEVLVQADYLRDKRITDFGIPAYLGRPVDVDPKTYYGAANAKEADTSESRVFSQTVSLVQQLGDNTSLRNGFRHYDYALDRRNTLTGAVLGVTATRPRPLASLNRSNFFRDEDGWSNQLELTHKATLAGTVHTMLVGVEIARQTKSQLLYSRNNFTTVDLFNPVLPVVQIDLGGTPATNNTGKFRNEGVYVQDLIDFGSGFKALLGLRHDWFDQQTIQKLALPNVSRKDSEWSPRVGLVFQPDNAQSYYVSYSKSFQPSGEGFALAVNNADIEPEKTTNKEVGAKYTLFDGQLGATLSLFELKRTGIKQTVPGTTTIIPIGTQRTRGIEATLHLDLPSGFRAIAGYSYLDAKIIQSVAIDDGQPVLGKRATLTPKHSANVFVTKSFGERFGLGAGANYVADRFANPGNTVVLPKFVTVDALGWVQLGKIRLQANVYNLFDRRYIVSGHGTSPNLNLPGAPRTVLGTVRLTL
ncbi:catecholate siderophore receptor [Novosphingobium kunmingense]|uniref:Catecholate siderophore receptor n=1 Tax=Novosphingobium kunmingense TaxID=1211806 RepID=A0A2N0I2F5_9SPHN|nr:TonB-dependent siderophore receptor [Novosphingobium kunmingense]PKB25362.1 catecholate siderophore receptor [Novosphingobium kunmingense]